MLAWNPISPSLLLFARRRLSLRKFPRNQWLHRRTLAPANPRSHPESCPPDLPSLLSLWLWCSPYRMALLLVALVQLLPELECLSEWHMNITHDIFIRVINTRPTHRSHDGPRSITWVFGGRGDGGRHLTEARKEDKAGTRNSVRALLVVVIPFHRPNHTLGEGELICRGRGACMHHGKA